MKRSCILATACLFLSVQGASAAVCDYKPSKLKGIAAASLAGGAAAGGSAAMSAAGYYSLVHAGSGLAMLGSTAAGASAAGTIGIIAGTAGPIGTVGAILLSPITLVVGTTVAAGGVAFEGACYFQVERITDPDALLAILSDIVEHDGTASLVNSREGQVLRLEYEDGPHAYLVENLYVADGRLIHSDWGPNTDLGPIVLVTPEDDE